VEVVGGRAHGRRKQETEIDTKQHEPSEPDGGSNSSRRREREREMHVNTLGLCNCHAVCIALLYLGSRSVEVVGGRAHGRRKQETEIDTKQHRESIHNEHTLRPFLRTLNESWTPSLPQNKHRNNNAVNPIWGQKHLCASPR